MTNDTLMTVLVGFGSAVIGALATLLVPVIQKRLDKKGLSDEEMFKYWRSAFDRPAFRGPFMFHSDMQRFDKAIRDTIQAIDNGFAPSQNPAIHGAPKSYLKHSEWSKIMDQVAGHLQNLTWFISGRTPHSPEQIQINADDERDAAVRLLNEVLVKLKLRPLEIPTEVAVAYTDVINP